MLTLRLFDGVIPRFSGQTSDFLDKSIFSRTHPPTFWVNCKTARDHWGNDMTDLVLPVVIDPVKVSDEILYMTWFSAIGHQTGLLW